MCFIDLVEISLIGLGLGIVQWLKLVRFDCVKKIWQVMKLIYDWMVKGYIVCV